MSEAYKKSNEYSQQALVTHISPVKAVALMQKAIECNPKNASLYIQAADIFIKNKQLKEALKTLNQGIAAVPGAPYLYEKRVSVLLALNDLHLAIANANALVTYKPDSKNFCLRADIEEKMHDKNSVVRDLMSAIVASEQAGEDAMDEVDRLEAFTGKKVQRPTLATNKSEALVRSIAILANSDKTFEPNFIQRQLGVSLYEIPINGKPNFHTGEFRLRIPTENFSEITLDTKDSSQGAGLRLDVDTTHCYITANQIAAVFGKPAMTDDDPPGRAGYRITGGGISCEYYRHGFMLLKQVVIGKRK
ncbi:MAG: tetratricopeptide repeat protein [Candidatus Obscuribacterales bacterium]|nr:tetratricopeptide repeat protein [Candidatus Obscuribacterales bacterium]